MDLSSGDPEGQDTPYEPGGSHSYRRRLVAALVVLAVLAAAGVALLLKRPPPVCIAVATSLTGSSAPEGTETLAAIELAVDQANRTGGVRDRRIELVLHDDRSSPEVARRNVAAIARGRCLAVLGHYLSSISLAAGPLYRDARIPALTGSAFVDQLTQGNPWYFRAQITASMQGRAIAEYLTVLNGGPPIRLLQSADSFGDGFASAFVRAYPPGRVTVAKFDPSSAERKASAERVVSQLPEGAQRSIVVLGTGADNIPDVVMAMRRSGRSGPVIAPGGAGSAEFAARFAAEPEERARPGFFTNNLYATPPVIFDSASAKAQAFAARYREKTGRQPSWIAAGGHDAANILIEALRRAELDHGSETRAQDRDRLRAALAAMNGPLTGVPGLTRPLYFNARRNMPGPIRMGVFWRGQFVTAPRQLVPVERPETLNLARESEAGHTVEIAGQPFWVQRVVYAGMDFNRVNRLDMKEGTFDADLNLWLRFHGDGMTATQIEFPDLLDRAGFDPAKPLEVSVIQAPAYMGMPIGSRQFEPFNYRLYRIAAPFKANYDLHDYPFDQQQLLVRFINRSVRRELITYVVDNYGLPLANTTQRLPSDLVPFRGLQQWRVTGVRYFVEPVSLSSSLGRLSSDAQVPTEYSGFNLVVALKRLYGIFLIKALIPLVLLVMLVFTTLFLPGNLFRERINIPVTAILTSAVLLLSLNNQLGDTGYTVAIEYIFYAFFGLCLSAMLIGITYDALCEGGRGDRALQLARAGQVFYLAVVVVVIAVFWVRYAN